LAVTGRESRPTPIVRAYIDEKISGASLGPAYGAWVLSIAAFSEDLGTFGGGGMPKLALHGTNQPDLMGQYISSGCIRVPDEIINFIAETVPVGTVVDIVA
jgi:lipoprotein-anchoring transpeptidase ErfK/SrfK